MQNSEFRMQNYFTPLHYAHKDFNFTFFRLSVAGFILHFAFCILHLIKNALVRMLADGKEKAQGVAVLLVLRPAGLFYFSMDSAKIACFFVSIFYHQVFILVLTKTASFYQIVPFVVPLL